MLVCMRHWSTTLASASPEKRDALELLAGPSARVLMRSKHGTVSGCM